jgi:uncharacterized membrane protein YkoI
MNSKQVKQTGGIVVGALVLWIGIIGSVYAADGSQIQSPAYQSSIKVPNGNQAERDEAARLSTLAKIDAAQAATAASAQVPGMVLKSALDNENGNLVYSVEIKTAANEIKDVKVDAGSGAVLHVDAGGEDDDDLNEHASQPPQPGRQ